jgi:hypothetical protein
VGQPEREQHELTEDEQSQVQHIQGRCVGLAPCSLESSNHEGQDELFRRTFPQ